MALKDGQGTADSIDRLGQRLDRAIGRLSCDDQRLLADAINALESDGPAPTLERGGEHEGR
jgi:hypothetical protein